MQDILFEYQMNMTTWAYLSSLIIIAVYFKFRRFWSVRNLDILGLLAMTPGLLLVGHNQEHLGYIWLFTVGAFFLVRLLCDPLMVRRPILEPNLSASGLTFAAAALLVFLMSNVITPDLKQSDLEGAQWMDQLLEREDSPEVRNYLSQHGPGYPLFFIFSSFSNSQLVHNAEDDPTIGEPSRRAVVHAVTTRTTTILAHLALVAGIILIGYRHFDNIHAGIAAAALYLLLPYMTEYTPRVDHVVPAALLVWAVEAYRRPMVAGVLLGLAAGVIYFPLFLLPLWCGFYWRRGLLRFVLGFGIVLVILALSLAVTSSSFESYLSQLQHMFGVRNFLTVQPTGFWEFHKPAFRIPVFAAFLVLSGSLAVWPVHKNLGTLFSMSAAVMLSTQFWKADQGGIYMAWYLPLLILTIFRPNLEDRVALSAVSETWLRRRPSK